MYTIEGHPLTLREATSLLKAEALRRYRERHRLSLDQHERDLESDFAKAKAGRPKKSVSSGPDTPDIAEVEDENEAMDGEHPTDADQRSISASSSQDAPEEAAVAGTKLHDDPITQDGRENPDLPALPSGKQKEKEKPQYGEKAQRGDDGIQEKETGTASPGSQLESIPGSTDSDRQGRQDPDEGQAHSTDPEQTVDSGRRRVPTKVDRPQQQEGKVRDEDKSQSRDEEAKPAVGGEKLYKYMHTLVKLHTSCFVTPETYNQHIQDHYYSIPFLQENIYLYDYTVHDIY